MTSIIQTATTVRIAYQLPADPSNQFKAWQRHDGDTFPEDRAHHAAMNRKQFAAKSAAGLIRRRPRVA